MAAADPGEARRPERDWAVGEALAWTVDYLTRKGVENPRRSAEWLLSAATDLSRIELYARFDRPLSPGERVTLREGIERRAAGEPLQYVTGEMPFRHLVLKVRPGVFIPRPETEVLVDEVLKHLDAAGAPEPVVVDLCTGSGAISVSVAYERPGARVYATEIVPATVEVARENAERCGVADRLAVLEGDLFGPLPDEARGRVDVVVSNPPYIPTADLAGLPAEVGGFEPRVALDGGPDGLDVARRIIAEAGSWLRPGGMLAMELDEARVAVAADEMRDAFDDVRVVCDLAGRPRIAAGTSRS
jgi:release factor glutamine methyltransferase